MTIHVEPLSQTRALVVRTPSIAARVVYGARPSSDLAVLSCGAWCWIAPSRGYVGAQIEQAIEKAVSA